jgi:uncharacterized OB-fold protein
VVLILKCPNCGKLSQGKHNCPKCDKPIQENSRAGRLVSKIAVQKAGKNNKEVEEQKQITQF